MRMIIDTDAGIDDAEALLMALTYPGNTVEAITTVTGNVHRDKVNCNVCSVLQLTGKHVPVYSGAARPLVGKWEHDDRRVHQSDGLGDWDERPPVEVTLEPEHAANALVRLVNESPGELTLVGLGPLTNIALAVHLDPTFPQKLKQFVFMGGTSHAVGNTPTVSAEFNIWVDPEAAYIVLDAFEQSTMLGWEATLDHPISWEDHARFCALGTPNAIFYEGINRKVTKRYRNIFAGHLIPDPLAMAITLKPQLILEQSHHHVTVELHGHITRGQTVVNYTRWATGKRNVSIIQQVDMDGVIRLYEQMLGSGTII